MIVGKARKVHNPDVLEWTGDLVRMQDFTNDPRADQVLNFALLTPRQAARIYKDDRFTAEVYDYLHKKWIPLKTGDIVMKGIKGECYPCDRTVYDETYETLQSEGRE